MMDGLQNVESEPFAAAKNPAGQVGGGQGLRKQQLLINNSPLVRLSLAARMRPVVSRHAQSAAHRGFAAGIAALTL